MNITLLNDLETGNTDAVIISEITTTEDIRNIIDKVKEELGFCNFEDIEEKLPDDCRIKARWLNNIEVAVY